MAIIDKFPRVTPREDDSIIKRYLEAHDAEFDNLSVKRGDVLNAKQIDNATEDELNRLGELFGQIGKRQGREDTTYRSFLKSVVASFNGRGSVDGLKFAVSSAIGADKENVRIIEDFENLEYTIEIVDLDTEFITSAVNDLAELADPSVVQLNEAIIVVEGEEIVIVETPVTVTDEGAGLGDGTLLDGNTTLG